MAYEKVGELVVDEKGLAFKHAKGEIKVAKAQITKVEKGLLKPDLTNLWIIVHYKENDEKLIAAFTTAPFSRARHYDRIYDALAAMIEAPAARE